MRLAQGKTSLENRKLNRDEFMVRALDHIISENYPTARKALHAEAARRAEAFNVLA
jgi:hypothetical protein